MATLNEKTTTVTTTTFELTMNEDELRAVERVLGESSASDVYPVYDILNDMVMGLGERF